jgi:hypothetical protein
MIVQTAEIEIHVDPALPPAQHFVQTRKAFQHTKRALEQLAPLPLLPTAAEKYRGRFAFVQGGTGVADALYVCHKDSTDAYIWTQVV